MAAMLVEARLVLVRFAAAILVASNLVFSLALLVVLSVAPLVAQPQALPLGAPHLRSCPIYRLHPFSKAWLRLIMVVKTTLLTSSVFLGHDGFVIDW